MEEEYFVEGKAHRYDFKTKPGVATPLDTHYPYKTRMIVRRPVNPEKFNGTVVIEWLNVSAKYDIDSDWWQLYDYLMRSGYAWVEVSAQPAGVHSPQGLRNWNPARYGSLDVAVDTIDLEGPLRFDIFLQAVMALKGNPKVQPLGNLHPEFIIATGHSRSAWMLMRRPIEEILDRLHRFHGFPNVQPDPLPLWIRSCHGSSQQMDQTTPVRHTHRNEYR